jgi:hypothetical protein
MDGIITVKEKEVEETTIPTYPVNASGNRLDRFPVHTLTSDDEYDIDLGWDPQVILTGEPVTFIIDFFDVRTNERLHLLPYDFVVHENGTEIDRISDISQVGSDSQMMLFSEPGPITIRIENVGNTPAYTEFNTLVYENPEQQSSEGLPTVDSGIVNGQTNKSKWISPLTLVYVTYAIIAGIPAAVAVIVILYRKGKI